MMRDSVEKKVDRRQGAGKMQVQLPTLDDMADIAEGCGNRRTVRHIKPGRAFVQHCDLQAERVVGLQRYCAG